MPCTYARETYLEVLSWLDNTPIKYAPNPKQKQSKSFVRYAKYSKAKTVGEALRLGTYYLDLLFDFEHGHLRAAGGPKRSGLVDPNKSAWDDTWTKTDKVLSRMHNKWIQWSKTFEVADRLGVDRRNLTSNKQGGLSVELHATRIEAEVMSKLILETADTERQPVTDADVLHVLRLWGFRQNVTRQNVMREGVEWVNSDTLGLLAGYDGTVSVNGATRFYPSVTKLVCRWLKDHLPAELSDRFVFTSINVNKGYAAKLHRDGNNEGPSMIRAFGEFTGGRLHYWPEDDKTKATLDTLKDEDKLTIDLTKNLLLFDGCRGHAVEDFEGERFTIVYFSIGRAHKASEADRQLLRDVGVPFPDTASMASTKAMLSPPLGYGDKAQPHPGGKRNTHRLWPRREGEVRIVDTLSEERIRQAKEAAKFVEPPQEDDDAPPDTTFVGHAMDRKILDDGRRMLRVYLKGASGRLVLAATGVEEKKGSARYEYKRVDSFTQGKPLCSHQLADVRAWVAAVVKNGGAPAGKGQKRKKPDAADTKAAKASAIKNPKLRRGSQKIVAKALVTPEKKSRKTTKEDTAGREGKVKQTTPEKPKAAPSGSKKEALEAFLMCGEGTPIKYVPNAKTAASHKGSYERYAAYSKAKTLSEALELGSSSSDLLYDWQAGFLKISASRTPKNAMKRRRRSSSSSPSFVDEDVGSSRFGRLLGRWRRTLEHA
mmetsp:Transcript_19346/g.56213  ORF Transcript_19346/g.56213 Transcript_19346/m.56213 type:complete len:711 (+) Transcript_19346:72-2204(+)